MTYRNDRKDHGHLRIRDGKSVFEDGTLFFPRGLSIMGINFPDMRAAFQQYWNMTPEQWFDQLAEHGVNFLRRNVVLERRQQPEDRGRLGRLDRAGGPSGEARLRRPQRGQQSAERHARRRLRAPCPGAVAEFGGHHTYLGCFSGSPARLLRRPADRPWSVTLTSFLPPPSLSGPVRCLICAWSGATWACNCRIRMCCSRIASIGSAGDSCCSPLPLSHEGEGVGG